jgi:hypothetical protein
MSTQENFSPIKHHFDSNPRDDLLNASIELSQDISNEEMSILYDQMLEALIASLPEDNTEVDYLEIKQLVNQTFATEESLGDFITYAAT